MKNKLKTVIRAIISILLIVCIGNIGLKIYFDYESRKDDEADEMIAQAQYLANAMRVTKDLEERGIEIKQNYKDMINKNGKRLINLRSQRVLQVTTIGEMLYISNELDQSKNNKLLAKLEEYYDKDRKLFAVYPCKGYQKEEDKNESVWITFSITLYNELKGTNFLDKYQLEEGFAQWYNAHIKEEKCEDDLIDIFWLLYDNNRLDLIDANTICPLLKDRVLEDEKYLKDTKENSMSAIFCVDEIDSYYSYFDKSDAYTGCAEKIFAKINSAKQLEYDKEDSSFVQFLCIMLESIDNVEQNSFFVNNIGTYLEENYRNTYLN